jgi:hypothetical protein
MPGFHGNKSGKKCLGDWVNNVMNPGQTYQGVNIVDLHHTDMDDGIVDCRANRIEHGRVIVHISAIFNTASNSFSVKVGSRSNSEISILLFYTICTFFSQ